jgi:hypothetical protein
LDQAGPKAPLSTPWLVLAIAAIVLAGLVTAGVRIAAGDGHDRAVVSAAGERSGTVDVTSTVTVPFPAQSSTPTTAAVTTTTVRKAAVDVLNAITGTTTTTRRGATTTTRPATTTTTRPAATTTVPPPTTVAPTTTTVARFTANMVNNHTQHVLLTVNGQQFPLAPTETVDVDLPISGRGDVVQARLTGNTDCGVSDSGEIFRANTRYRVAIVVGDTKCSGSDLLRPRLDIARL